MFSCLAYKMTTIRGNTWQTALSDLQSTQLVNDHMAEVMGLLPFRGDVNTCIDSISKNPGLAILLVDGFSELMVLHNLQCLPANVYRAEPKLVALCGKGAVADCYHIDSNVAFSDLEFPTPIWHDLKTVSTGEALKNLLPQDPSTTSYKGKQTMVVPPLVLVTILETDSLPPEVLIPALSAKFQEFNRSSQTVKACTILRPVLEFLWAVAHKKGPASVIGVDQSKDAQEWSNKVHLSNVVPLHLQLGPPPFAPPPQLPNPPQDQSSTIVGELRLLRDVTEKQHLRELSLDEDKKKDLNGWEKLHEEVQTMV
jgi:hypothetical protein